MNYGDSAGPNFAMLVDGDVFLDDEELHHFLLFAALEPVFRCHFMVFLVGMTQFGTFNI